MYGILKAHSANIQIESKVGTGTTMRLFFRSQQNGSTVSSQPEQSVLIKGSEKILLVDDEENILNPLTLFLSKLGYSITAFSSSAAALECFKNSSVSFDLIITDMLMPELTGMEIIREIRKIDQKVKVILCTGNHLDIDENALTHYSVSRLLLKPYRGEFLVSTIRNVLDEN